MSWIITSIRENPELAIFLTLALGFLIGRIRIGSFKLGNVVGTLMAGVLVGQLGVVVHPLVKIVFFDLFLFATGYKVGPQFFRGLSTSAAPQVLLTVVLCVTSLIATVVAARVMGYDSGTAAGLMAGAFTESTVIGTAGNTIEHLDLSAVEKARLLNNIPIAYAVSYLVGTGFVVWFLSVLAPKILGIDLRAESRELEGKVPGGPKEQIARSAYREWDIRAYRLHDSMVDRAVEEVERDFAPERVFIERIRRGETTTEVDPKTILRRGDIAVFVARRSVFLASDAPLAEEVEDPELLDFPMAALELVVTNKEIENLTIAEVAEEFGRGVVLLKFVRAGEEVPFVPGTMLNRGDVLHVVGSQTNVERAGKALGYIQRPSSETDVVFVGLGILIGGLVGSLTFRVGNLPLSLTSSGGALIMGLVFGWLRSIRPTFGLIPEAALWVFDTIGLAVFIGVVGIGAGPTFVEGIRATGPSLLVVGFIIAVIPHVCALLFGRYVLRMNPVILLGACAGAGTVTAALRAIQDEAGSKLPVLGYTVPYAIGNILLTAWGPVIVMLTQ